MLSDHRLLSIDRKRDNRKKLIILLHRFLCDNEYHCERMKCLLFKKRLRRLLALPQTDGFCFLNTFYCTIKSRDQKTLRKRYRYVYIYTWARCFKLLSIYVILLYKKTLAHLSIMVRALRWADSTRPYYNLPIDSFMLYLYRMQNCHKQGIVFFFPQNEYLPDALKN